MFFRRLQLPQNDGLSARPGARVDRALLPWSYRANPIAAAQVHNLGSQGTPASRGVLRPASWISGVLLWQLPARNTLQIARVATRIIGRRPPLCCALLHRPAAVRAAVATNCCARQYLRCNLRRSQTGLRLSRCSHRDAMLACRGLTTRLAVFSSRRLPSLASRRAGMNALLD